MRYLSGIQPSGDFHIGNYFGMIRQLLSAQQEHEVFGFIVNYHAMTSVYDGPKLAGGTLQAAIDLLALGMDPAKSTFWVQSDVPEVLELYWVLSHHTPMGLLERAHSYKDKVAKGFSPHHGLFSYPVLMAADILLMDAEIVPVGKDQIQHVEIARDIAIKFNNAYGNQLKIPEFQVEESVAVVPGIDGAKMSKSYNNTIEIFLEYKPLKKKIGQIVTEPVALEDPKEWRTCHVYSLCKLFLDEAGQRDLQKRYEKGGEGHGHFKAYLADLIWAHFKEAREKREALMADPDRVRAILKSGADKARVTAAKKMAAIRQATGLSY
jgi:tryptophanyl-tRNA synthetase